MNFRQLAARFLGLFTPSFLPYAETRARGHTDFQDARFPDDTDSLDAPAAAAPKVVEKRTEEIGLAGMVHPRPAPKPPVPSTPEEIAAVERMLDQKKYEHYLGNFDDLQIEINSTIVPAADIKHYPAGKTVCDHFSVEHDNTVFVFWNKPSEEQRKIHAELHEKNMARKNPGTSAHYDLTGINMSEPIGSITLRTEKGLPYRGRPAEAQMADVSKLGAGWKPETGTPPVEKPKQKAVSEELKGGFLSIHLD